jgi:cytochrome c
MSRLANGSRLRASLIGFGLVMTTGLSAYADSPALANLGRPATPAEIRAWDIDVRPDFKGLPPGSGSVARGQEVWETKCENCHGAFGESNEVFTPIVGHTTKEDIKTGHVAALRSDTVPQRTTLMKLSELSVLWDYINRAMPWNAPKSLSTDDVYAVVAYILNLGGIVPPDFVLSDKNVQAAQNMLPNRNGKTREHGLWELGGKPDVQGSSCMTNCTPKIAVNSRLPDFARNAHGDIAAQNRLLGGTRGADTLQPAPTAFVALADRLSQGAAAAATAGGAGSAAAKLATQHACLACHGIGNKIVGPALMDIHKKYAAQKADAVKLLTVRIKSGGSGIWGSIAMPAQDHVPDADIRAIAEWIAAGKFQ